MKRLWGKLACLVVVGMASWGWAASSSSLSSSSIPVSSSSSTNVSYASSLSSSSIPVSSSSHSGVSLISKIADISVDEDEAIDSIPLEEHFSGANLYEAVLSDSSILSASLSIGTDVVLSLVLEEDANGVDSVFVTAIDTLSSDTLLDTFVVTIEAVNDAPVVVETISDVQLDEDNTEAVEISDLNTVFSDPEGEDLTYSITSDSSLFSSDISADGVLTLTLVANAFDTVELTVTATDPEGATASTSFILEVANVNDAPTIISRISAIYSNEDVDPDSMDLSNYFSDPDGDSLSYSVSESALYEASISDGVLSFNLTSNAYDTVTVTVIATDASDSVSTTFTLGVASVNDPPVFSSMDTLEVALGETATVTLSATDVEDGAIDRFAVNTEPAHGTASITNTVLTYTAGTTEADTGIQWLSFLAYDSEDLTSTDTLYIHVYGSFSISSFDESSSSFSESSSSSASDDLIDDFEDGDAQSLWGGYWYTYTDSANEGASTVTPSTSNDSLFSPTALPDNGTTYAGKIAYTLDVGSATVTPYVGIGVYLRSDESALDISTCTTISYEYFGAAHSFRVETGNVEDYDFYLISEEATDAWTTVTASWSEFAQSGWGTAVDLDLSAVTQVSWQVQDSSGKEGSLWIDNVRCVGMELPSNSSIVESSSSAIASSSAIVSSSSQNGVMAIEFSGLARGEDPSLFRDTSMDVSDYSQFCLDLAVTGRTSGYIEVSPALKDDSWNWIGNYLYRNEYNDSVWTTYCFSVSNFQWTDSDREIQELDLMIFVNDSIQDFSGTVFFDNVRFDTDTLFAFEDDSELWDYYASTAEDSAKILGVTWSFPSIPRSSSSAESASSGSNRVMAVDFSDLSGGTVVLYWDSLTELSGHARFCFDARASGVTAANSLGVYAALDDTSWNWISTGASYTLQDTTWQTYCDSLSNFSWPGTSHLIREMSVVASPVSTAFSGTLYLDNIRLDSDTLYAFNSNEELWTYKASSTLAPSVTKVYGKYLQVTALGSSAVAVSSSASHGRTFFTETANTYSSSSRMRASSSASSDDDAILALEGSASLSVRVEGHTLVVLRDTPLRLSDLLGRTLLERQAIAGEHIPLHVRPGIYILRTDTQHSLLQLR